MKKKILSGVLALCMIFGSAAALPEGVFETSSTITASAASKATSGKCGDNVNWSLKNGVLTISGKGKMNNYGYIADFNNSPFCNRTDIKSVVIKSGVTSVGDTAFDGCKNLKSVTISSSVKTIGNKAFVGCSSLTSVTISSGVESIGKYAFFSCTSLTSITVPNSVTSIGDSAFLQCSSLSSVTIPSSVTSIGSFAFSETKWLENQRKKNPLVIVNGILIDGKKCKGTVTIPISVNSISDSAFSSCESLTSVTIPSSVVTIGNYAFSFCSNLSKVTLGRNVKVIGDASFKGTKIASITIPASVTEIGSEAFKEVTTLKTVKIENGKNKTIDDYAFNGCTGLTSVDLGKSTYIIGADAFAGCTALTSITIPDCVKVLSRRAFQGCTKLASAKIGNGVMTVGYLTFGGCTALKTVTFGTNIEQIDDYAFENCSSLEKVVLMPKTAKIGTASFGGCSSLKSIIMPGVKSIGERAFQYDIKLSEVIMAEGKMESILYNAFYKNESLTKVVIPESTTNIGTHAFGYYINKNGEVLKRKDFTIYGVKGSDANAYANDNGFKFVAIAKHTCNYAKVVVPNTCTEKGYTVNVCKICGKVKETNTVKAAGHKWSEWKVVTTANCAHAGLKTHYCTVCGKYATATIAKTTDHKWSDWKTTGFSFKNKTSTQKRTCSVCKKSSTRTNQGAIKRLAGDNRYATAAKLSSTMYKTANTVVLATGLTYQDALVAVPLAAAYDAPLLLGTEKHITDQTLAELKRLKAKNVIVVSTNGAIGSKAKAELKGYKVTSIAGKNYYETATKVAKALQAKTKKAPDTIFFATDSAFADALSASPIAAIKNAPIIYLKNKGSIDSATAAYLKSVKGKVKNAYVIGGDGVISDAMMKNVATALGLKSGKTVVRVAGKNRYETCVAVNKKFKSVVSSEGICVAKGLDFPDALAGGVYAAKNKQALFLADGNKLQDVQSSYLKSKNAAKITALGGTGAVSDDLVKVIIKASI